MLKKAGIVVAAATAGLLAVAPLAFAADRGDSGNSPRGSYSSTSESYDIDLENDSADCDLANVAPITNENAGGYTGFALLGAVTGTLTQTFTAANAPVQTLAPAASCNNFTYEDNEQDNDTTIDRSLNG